MIKVAVWVAGLPASSVVSAVRVRVPSSRPLTSTSASNQVPSAAMEAVPVTVLPPPSSMLMATSRPLSTSKTEPVKSTSSCSAALILAPASAAISATSCATGSYSITSLAVASLPAVSDATTVSVRSPCAREDRSSPFTCQAPPVTVAEKVRVSSLISVMVIATAWPSSMPVTVPPKLALWPSTAFR